MSIGGRNILERKPETVELEWALTLAIDWIKIQESVGDCVSNQSDTVSE